MRMVLKDNDKISIILFYDESKVLPTYISKYLQTIWWYSSVYCPVWDFSWSTVWYTPLPYKNLQQALIKFDLPLMSVHSLVVSSLITLSREDVRHFLIRANFKKVLNIIKKNKLTFNALSWWLQQHPKC